MALARKVNDCDFRGFGMTAECASESGSTGSPARNLSAKVAAALETSYDTREGGFPIGFDS
jgi:hypothetical protein